MGQKFKVMVVDDQLWVRAMLLEALNSSGYRTFGASDGLEALEMAYQEKPDIALVDMTIPGIDGITLLSHLKEKMPEVATIFMSGCSSNEYLKRAREEGAVACLVKPFDLQELKAVLDKVSATLDLAARGEGEWETGFEMGRLIS
ncbi:response regulator [Thermoanaerobacterium sp. DL9XJH110]|uniref:response regulator n=1 Tax=Thermoanaerobacterium sp. DL9XJH110 TaxID=3386643 RepID=UPI003BB770D4